MKEVISCIRNLPKHIGTAFFNLFRNGTMTIYSILAVMVTLALMGAIGVIALNIDHMTKNIESSLSIYVKLDREITDEEAAAVGEQIQALDGIDEVIYSSKEEQLQNMIEYYDVDGEGLFEDYQGDNNPLANSYSVQVKDANQLEEITALINEIPHVNKANYGGSSTSTLVNILEQIRNYGAIFVLGLVVVVVLIISSTIHITIENRQSEVEIMRMVGASNWYIRIPFMIEGALIGLIGAIIPILVIYIGYTKIYSLLQGQLLASMLVLVKPDKAYLVCHFLAGIGTIVGLLGSSFAIRKHLKK